MAQGSTSPKSSTNFHHLSPFVRRPAAQHASEGAAAVRGAGEVETLWGVDQPEPPRGEFGKKNIGPDNPTW